MRRRSWMQRSRASLPPMPAPPPAEPLGWHRLPDGQRVFVGPRRYRPRPKATWHWEFGCVVTFYGANGVKADEKDLDDIEVRNLHAEKIEPPPPDDNNKGAV